MSRSQREPVDPGVVYAIRGAGGFVKIGHSTNLIGRMSTLQSSSAVPLTLIAWHPGDVKLEKSLHARFAAYRRSGEWFELSPGQVLTLRGLLSTLPYVVDLPRGRRRFIAVDRRPR